MHSDQAFEASGKTFPDSLVTIWLQREDDKPFGQTVESDAEGNFHFIAEAIVLALHGRDDVPDDIYLFETEIEPWTIWVIKRGGELFPVVPDQGPHEFGPTVT